MGRVRHRGGISNTRKNVTADPKEIAHLTESAKRLVKEYQHIPETPQVTEPLNPDRWEWKQLQMAHMARSTDVGAIWSIFRNSWTAHGVLLVALFAGDGPPTRLQEVVVPSMGIFASLAWLLVQTRVSYRIERCEEVIRGIEQELRIPEARRVYPPLVERDDRRRPWIRGERPFMHTRRVMQACALVALVAWSVALVALAVAR